MAREGRVEKWPESLHWCRRAAITVISTKTPGASPTCTHARCGRFFGPIRSFYTVIVESHANAVVVPYPVFAFTRPGLAGAPVEQGHQGSLFSLGKSNYSNALSWSTATSLPAGEEIQDPEDSIRPESSACASNLVERRVLPGVTRNKVEGSLIKSVARR